MVNLVRDVEFRQSYVEPDIYVRGPTGTGQEVPGVEFMQGFEQSKDEFELFFLKSAPGAIDSRASRSPTFSRENTGAADALRAFRSFSLMKKDRKNATLRQRRRRRRKGLLKSAPTSDFASAPTSRNEIRRSARLDAPTANLYADNLRREAARLQRSIPPDLEGAGRAFERAVSIRAQHGLFCTRANALAHLEYAQNLSRRVCSAESEYHLRTALSIYRLLNLRHTLEYADALLFIASLIDQQFRLEEAENFYRSALAVYKLQDTTRDRNRDRDSNARVAIDALCRNLRTQGRPEEVDDIVKMAFDP